MTTREIYFKYHMTYDLPCAFVHYIKKIDIGMSIEMISMLFDEEHHESNIERMIEIEEVDGFMHWSFSEEGEKILKSIKFSNKVFL